MIVAQRVVLCVKKKEIFDIRSFSMSSGTHDASHMARPIEIKSILLPVQGHYLCMEVIWAGTHKL